MLRNFASLARRATSAFVSAVTSTDMPAKNRRPEVSVNGNLNDCQWDDNPSGVGTVSNCFVICPVARTCRSNSRSGRAISAPHKSMSVLPIHPSSGIANRSQIGLLTKTNRPSSSFM